MLHHNTQQKIIQKLSHTNNAHFSELKPKNIESNAFNYHMKSLLTEGFIAKGESGSYSLTSLGKKVGVNANMSFADWVSQAHSILLMALQNEKGEYLLRRRKIQPMRGYLGFLHGEPSDTQTVTETANQLFKRSTGLDADFSVRGSGFSRFLNGKEAESFNNLTILYANSYKGSLKESGQTGDNIWMSPKDALADDKLFPNMPPIFKNLESGEFFWFDMTRQI